MLVLDLIPDFWPGNEIVRSEVNTFMKGRWERWRLRLAAQSLEFITLVRRAWLISQARQVRLRGRVASDSGSTSLVRMPTESAHLR